MRNSIVLLIAYLLFRNEHKQQERERLQTDKRKKHRVRRRRRYQNPSTSSGGSGKVSPKSQTSTNQRKSWKTSRFLSFMIALGFVAAGAALVASLCSDEANVLDSTHTPILIITSTPSPTPRPTPTPRPLAVPTSEVYTNPTITIGIDRNGPEGIERAVDIKFSDLVRGSTRYSYVVSSSDHRCNGLRMGDFISIEIAEDRNATASVRIAASCPPGTHDFNVKLYRNATLIAERQTVFGVASSTPKPTATSTPTYTPIPIPTSTPTATVTRTATPTSTWTPTPTNTVAPTSTLSPTATRTLTPLPTNTATLTPTATQTATSTPTPTSTPRPAKYVALSSGSWHVCALQDDGRIACWGGGDPQYDRGQSAPPDENGFVAVTSGRYHSCALHSTGNVKCWGDNSHGQLNPPQNEDFVSIASGLSALHTCGIRVDGFVACWGSIGGLYDYGQASPPSDQRFLAISAGFAHSCAIKQNGQIQCWGVEEDSIDSGQASPLHDHSHTFKSISSGFSHTCALRDDGVPVCWGANKHQYDHGQTSSPIGVRLSGLSSGVNHTCGFRFDGTTVCWGAERSETNRGQASPPDDEQITAISSGRDHTCGLRRDGNVTCWGVGAKDFDIAASNDSFPDEPGDRVEISPTRVVTVDTTTDPTPTATYTPVPPVIATSTSTATPSPFPIITPTPTPTSTSKPPLNLADMVDRARSSVVRVEGQTSTGSGFVVDGSGYILTNEHVITDQSRLSVVFDDGTRLTATIVASDVGRDIALLKVTTSTDLTPLPFAYSVRQGDEVVALGHPLDLGTSMTITKGIVSAFRTFRGVSYIQTDAAINPGNSGGPLLNTLGEVVGMNTSSVDESTSGRPVEGIGFAIKYDVLASRFEIMKYGSSRTLTPTPRAVPTQTARYAFGPESGSIKHDPFDGYIDVYRANLSVADAVIEARFANPYSTEVGNWSSGFIFRKTDANVVHIVIVNSNGTWYHYLRTGDVETQQDLAAEYSNHIDTTARGSNHVRIIANGSEGWLFINGAFAGDLNLSGLTDAGSVSAVGSYFQGDGVAGRSTRFEDFAIRSLRRVYGPMDGSIKHDPDDGFIDESEASIWLTEGIIEAEFSNPYTSSQGDWSSGFLFRKPASNTFHAIVIQEDGRWHHDLRLGDADGTQDLTEQYSYQISTTISRSNHIRIIMLGNEGWLFINGTYVGKLDLSELTAPGQVSAITNYFTDDGIAGYSTRIENFTIWSADGP